LSIRETLKTFRRRYTVPVLSTGPINLVGSNRFPQNHEQDSSESCFYFWPKLVVSGSTPLVLCSHEADCSSSFRVGWDRSDKRRHARNADQDLTLSHSHLRYADRTHGSNSTLRKSGNRCILYYCSCRFARRDGARKVRFRPFL